MHSNAQRLVSCILGFVLAASFLGVAQSSNTVVGTWKLISAKSTAVNGKVDPYAFGKTPSGFMTFTPEGRMSLIMSDDARKPLSVLDRVAAPEGERAQAFATCVAYAGRYSRDGDRLIYHVEVSSIQNWVGTDLTRIIKFDGDELSTRTPTTVKGGVQQVIELEWKRVN
jgi:hypothetical protein